jgi:hypothetical protein
MDARLHQLQGKARLVTSREMLELLREFHRDKIAERQRHGASARVVQDYDFNNTYQYVIAREDMQISWVVDAIADFGGTADEGPASRATGDMTGEGSKLGQRRKKDADGQARALTGDRDAAQAFVEKWRPRIDGLPNARHRNMLRVILGETMEHRRFFEQALAGRSDLLGRRADGAGTPGVVIPTRWVE